MLVNWSNQVQTSTHILHHSTHFRFGATIPHSHKWGGGGGGDETRNLERQTQQMHCIDECRVISH